MDSLASIHFFLLFLKDKDFEDKDSKITSSLEGPNSSALFPSPFPYPTQGALVNVLVRAWPR